MGMSFVHWAIMAFLLVSICAWLWAVARLDTRVGPIAFLFLLMNVPFLNGWALLWFSYARWKHSPAELASKQKQD